MFDEVKPPTAWENLIRSVVGFPKYALEWTIGLTTAVLSDLHVTTLAVTGALTGVALDSLIWGFVTFFGLYSLSRVVALVSNAIGFGAQGIAKATGESGYVIASIFRDAQTQHESTVDREGVDFVG